MASGISRSEAWTLLCEWTESDSLRRHMLAVEAAMRAYASRFGGDEELWGVTGLLHDLDYERYPDLSTGHPRMAIAELERRGYPPELVRAVASHADFMDVPRETDMEKALSANWSEGAVAGIKQPADGLNGDIHGSAEYRAHLVTVMAKRAVAAAG